MQTNNERGIALISVLLIMTMISALLIGFTTMTVSDQRFRFIDRDRNQSFYAASAGLVASPLSSPANSIPLAASSTTVRCAKPRALRVLQCSRTNISKNIITNGCSSSVSAVALVIARSNCIKPA